MSDIDWSKAPEWATVLLKHLYCTSTAWASSHADGAKAESIDQGGMTFELVARAWRVVANRPSPAWNGEGLPPVGTVCEWKEKTGFQWVSAEVLFISESSVVMRRADGFEWQMLTARTSFRPIRTQEQIKADEREAAIEEMRVAVGSRNNFPFAELYDAGYRKH